MKAGRRGGRDTAEELKARDGRCSHSTARVSHRPPLDGPGERAQRVWRRITESQRARSSEHGVCSGVGSERAQGSERGVWGGMLLFPRGLGAAITACGAASDPSGPRGASEASGETPWWSVHGAGGEGSCAGAVLTCLHVRLSVPPPLLPPTSLVATQVSQVLEMPWWLGGGSRPNQRVGEQGGVSTSAVLSSSTCRMSKAAHSAGRSAVCAHGNARWCVFSIRVIFSYIISHGYFRLQALPAACIIVVT